MESIPLHHACDPAFVRRVEQESGQTLAACYQCGNCTAGCPAGFAYDMQANQIIRGVQLGLKERVLSSRSLWHCLGCSTCSQRCPNNIAVAEVMETLRHMARREGSISVAPVNKFWLSFLETVRRFGRSYELGVMALYKIRSGRLFGDMDIAYPALSRGKLGFLPHVIESHGEVSRIFERYKARCEKEGVKP
ncbi:MAG: 4Fe-4S dicluster domain-containing protein [Desulfovibrionaceae bacterium]|nr:4Fe-4S dicluster domain-containing protein [Desulfovibrionaceae bacterium]